MPAKEILCRLGCGLGVAFKFWLIGKSEIKDDGDDPTEYVSQILYPLNGGIGFGPGTGFFGRLFYDFGIPFRLGIEIAFVFACFQLLKSLFASPTRSYLSLMLFLVMILDPQTADLFSHLLSDQIVMVELLLGISAFVIAFQKRSKPNAVQLILAGFYFGLATITRILFLPVMISLLACALLLLAASMAGCPKAEKKGALFSVLLALGIPMLGISLVYYSVCVYNVCNHGYHGVSVSDSAEYRKFYLCLQSVGEPTGPAYFAVDENRRRLIAQAGPNSKWLMDRVENFQYYKDIGHDTYGLRDIPTAWLHLAVFSAIDADLGHSLAFLTKVEDEIADASHRGVFKVRSILPLPDCRVQVVLAVLPQGLLNTIKQVEHEPPPSAFAWDPRTQKYENPDFSRALHRRSMGPSPVREKIWRALCWPYSLIYAPTVVGFGFALPAVFLAVLLWKRKMPGSPNFIAQQAFVIFFVVLFAWYAFFDASGVPACARYLILNHILLPVLAAYYFAATLRQLRSDP